MITIENLQRMLDLENGIIHDQVNGLTNADSLIQPQPGGNCLNWVLGHLLTNQLEILEALGAKLPFNPLEVSRYARNSEPIIGDGEGVLPLEELVKLHDQTHTTLNTLLAAMKEEDFEREIQVRERNMTLGWRVFFLHFHYTYHLGQLEFLRQLAGKLDKII